MFLSGRQRRPKKSVVYLAAAALSLVACLACMIIAMIVVSFVGERPDLEGGSSYILTLWITGFAFAFALTFIFYILARRADG